MLSYNREDIKKLGLKGLRNNPDLKAFFFKEYSNIFGKVCMSCESKLEGYFINFLNHTEMGQESTAKFILKDKLIMTPIGNINRKNCTDEKAIALLATSKGFLKDFESYPENWYELVADHKDGKSTPSQPEKEKEGTGDVFKDKLISLPGIAAKTADKIIEQFATEAALEAHIAAAKELNFTPAANKALLDAYGG